MKNIFLLLISLILITILGCTNDTPTTQETLFGELYIRYVEENRTLKAEGNFLVGDSLATARGIKLGQGLNFNNSGMDFRNVTPKLQRYSYTTKSDFPENCTFKINDPIHEATFESSLTPLVSYGPEAPFSKTEGGNIILFDKPIDQHGEYVAIMSDKNNVATTLRIKGPTKGNILPVPAAVLKSLAVGDGEMFLVKKKLKTIQENHMNVNFLIEFYSKRVDIKIVK